MRKKIVIITLDSKVLYTGVVIFLLFIGIWLYNAPAVWTTLPLSSLISGKKVILDPGHGGFDSGAKSDSGLLEKEINLDVALRLKKYLFQVGIDTILTREDDRDFSDVENCITKKNLDLSYRLKLINNNKFDIMLSIHSNMFPQAIYSGAQTFYKSEDLVSKKLAITIQDCLAKHLGPNNRKAQPGNFRILNESKIPAVIIEIGFLSNPEEAARLATPEYRDIIAQTIAQGVVNFFCDKF